MEARRLLSASLVADLDTRPSRDFRPLQITESGGVGYFSQHDGTNGAELWRSDGTAGGTWMVKDIWPGAAGSMVGYLEHSVVDAGGTLFFAAHDGESGMELWKSDGTDAGTVRVADIQPGPDSSFPSHFLAVGTGIYFTAGDAIHGREVWHSDGTPDGTSIVKDIRPGAPGQVDRLGAALPDGTVFFQAHDGTSTGLWRTDGTAAGTILIKSRADGMTPASSPMVASGGVMYIPDAEGGLWASDGTRTGTVRVETGNSITGYVTEMADVGGTLFYVRAINPSTSLAGRLWARTGDAAFRITGPGASELTGASSLLNVGDTLYFAGSTATTGSELFQAFPMSPEATLVHDAVPGRNGSGPSQLTDVGGTVFYSTRVFNRGYELWRSDGTPATTTLVRPLNASEVAADAPADLTAVGGYLLLVNVEATTGAELWSSDGTPEGTGIVADTYPGTSWSFPTFFGSLGNRMLFHASQGPTDDLFVTDGTAAGTVRLTNRGGTDPTMRPSSVQVFGDVAYFSGGNATTGAEPWLTDGTPAGTRTLLDVRPGTAGSNPSDFTRVGGHVYFWADDGTHGSELWKTDGTPAGTALLKDIYPGATGAGGGDIVALGDTIYFTANTAAGGLELWTSDGTEAGTSQLVDIRPGAAGSAPANLAVINGTLYFSANGGSGVEPWKSDGTAAGTVLLKDIRPGIFDSSPAQFVGADDVVYFVANDGTTGAELWKTDGTPAGTLLVSDIRPGTSASSSPARLTAMNGRLYFTADDGTRGRELWSTAGTADTTGIVKDIYPGAWSGALLQSLMTAGGRLFFTGADGVSGTELWSSDGTAAGTARVVDLAPGTMTGILSLAVEGPGGTLYFAGNDTVTGFEPYKVDDTFAPYVVTASLAARGTLALDVRFSEGVADSLTGNVLRVLAAETGAAVNVGRVRVASYDGTRNVASFDFPDLPGGKLPPGNYVGVIAAGAVKDTAQNRLAGEYRFAFTVGAPVAEVAGRWVFYNGSALDGGDAAPAPADDNAIAADKRALLPGQRATFANITSYSRGIPGVMIDVKGLPQDVSLSASDFVLSHPDGATWAGAAPRDVAVRRGAGINGSDRVTLTFANDGIRNTWLRVTMLANDRTGLVSPDTFYFGNLVGETGDAAGGTMAVNVRDLSLTRASVGRTSTGALRRFDIDRDGSVTATDVFLVRANQRRTLVALTALAEATPAGPTVASAALARTEGRIGRRGVWAELMPLT